MLFQRKPPRPPERRNCAQCGKEIPVRLSRIEKSRSGLIFCSHTCAAHYQASLLESNARCHYCGKQFHRSPSELKRSDLINTYCSRECYERARQEDIAAKRRPAGRFGKHETKCDQCGTIFYLRPSRLNDSQHHFCSIECKRQFQTTTGSYVPRDYLKRRIIQCQICGLEQSDLLEVHHKDGNRKNNNLGNLLVVCPNCHTRIHKGLV